MSITAAEIQQLQVPGFETPQPRPQCVKCGSIGPTINGRCTAHLELATEGELYCISPEDFEAYDLDH